MGVTSERGETFGLSVFLRDGESLSRTTHFRPRGRGTRQRVDLPRPDLARPPGDLGGLTSPLAADTALSVVRRHDEDEQPGSAMGDAPGRAKARADLKIDTERVKREMANSRTISHGELRERLARLVKGPVLGAGDPAYEESRRVFNAMIDRQPAAILRCSCAEDVASGVIVAREYDLPLSVTGGGHSVAGKRGM